MSVQSDFVGGVAEIVDAMGSAFVLTDSTGATNNIRGVITSIGRDDSALVNAIGVEVRVFWCEKRTTPPTKFDTITGPDGVEYTIHTVHNVIVDDAVVAHKAYISA